MKTEPQPDTETEKDRFARLANKRVSKALKALRLVGNLSNKSLYEYAEIDIELIYSTLGAALKESRERFSEKPKPQDVFELNTKQAAA